MTLPVSSLPHNVLMTIQSGIARYTYKGVPCLKAPFDLALYELLIWRDKPRTIVEIGTWHGGSALWLADLLTTFDINGHVHSLDVAGQQQFSDPRITFHSGDVMQVAKLLPADWVDALPRPLLVIEDSSHFPEATTAVLDHFAPLMRSGEYIIVEDANVYEMGMADYYRGGPRRALQEFLSKTQDFFVDTEYCDYYGPNVTANVNGYLRKR